MQEYKRQQYKIFFQLINQQRKKIQKNKVIKRSQKYQCSPAHNTHIKKTKDSRHKHSPSAAARLFHSPFGTPPLGDSPFGGLPLWGSRRGPPSFILHPQTRCCENAVILFFHFQIFVMSVLIQRWYVGSQLVSCWFISPGVFVFSSRLGWSLSSSCAPPF